MTRAVTVAESFSSTVPVGTIIPASSSAIPTGYLACNGGNYSQSAYLNLYAILTSTWVRAWTNSESITTGDYRKNAAGVIYIATSTATTSGSDVGDDTGVTWSASSDFLVPDLRGEFLRGWANGSSNDPDAASRTGGDAVGSSQTNQIQSHQHGYTHHTNFGSGLGGGGSGIPFYAYTANTNSTGGNETRPRNIYVQYCIKF